MFGMQSRFDFMFSDSKYKEADKDRSYSIKWKWFLDVEEQTEALFSYSDQVLRKIKINSSKT